MYSVNNRDSRVCLLSFDLYSLEKFIIYWNNNNFSFHLYWTIASIYNGKHYLCSHCQLKIK